MKSIVALTLAASLAMASPVAKPGVIELRAAPSEAQNAYRKRDSSKANFLHKWAQKEGSILRGKYRYVGPAPSSKRERAVSDVTIQDDYEQGLDLAYYGPASLGTPEQTLQFLFDTGSSDVWTNIGGAESNCQTPAFDTAASTTYMDTGKPFIIQYGSGAVNGTIAYDKASLGGLTVQKQAFGAVFQCSPSFVGARYSGLVGLAFSSIAVTQQPTLVENLISEGELTSKEFAFHLGTGGATGTLTVGGTNPAYYTGPIDFTPVTSKTYWVVQAEQPIVQNQPVGTPFSAAIDTGTTLVYLPTAVATAIFNRVPGASIDQANTGDGSGGTFYKYPCNVKPKIDFTFAGISRSFPVDPANLNLGPTTPSNFCTAGIVGMDFQGVNGEDLAIIGDVFNKGQYDVFSYDAANGQPAVGFATLA